MSLTMSLTKTLKRKEKPDETILTHQQKLANAIRLNTCLYTVLIDLVVQYCYMSLKGKFQRMLAQFTELRLRRFTPSCYEYESGGIATFQNTVFFTDQIEHCVYQCSKEGKGIRKWGLNGSQDGNFSYPSAIAIDTIMKEVFVYDNRNNPRVQVFSCEGKFLRKWDCYENERALSRGIAIDIEKHEVYFYYPNSQIYVCTTKGAFVRSWFTDEGCGDSYSVIGGITLGSDKVYVVDSEHHFVKVYTKEGQYVCSWGKHGHEDGSLDYPCGICLNGDAEVYITDLKNHRVQVFTPEGVFLRKWGKKGFDNGAFTSPRQLEVNDDNLLFVIDCNGIQVFS